MADSPISEAEFKTKSKLTTKSDIVVALVAGSDATLTRYYPLPGGRVRLQPANASRQPIVVPAADVTVQGRLLAVLRKYK